MLLLILYASKLNIFIDCSAVQRVLQNLFKLPKIYCRDSHTEVPVTVHCSWRPDKSLVDKVALTVVLKIFNSIFYGICYVIWLNKVLFVVWFWKLRHVTSAGTCRVFMTCGISTRISCRQTWYRQHQQWTKVLVVGCNRTLSSSCMSVPVKLKHRPTLEQRSCHAINWPNRKLLPLLPHQMTENSELVMPHNNNYNNNGNNCRAVSVISGDNRESIFCLVFILIHRSSAATRVLLRRVAQINGR